MFKFKINGHNWEIIELDNDVFHEVRRKDGITQNERIKEDFFSFGYTNTVSQKIYLNKVQHREQLKSTLIHELGHCWLWTMGASYTSYCEDALCDTISASYDFIHEIVEEYFKSS